MEATRNDAAPAEGLDVADLVEDQQEERVREAIEMVDAAVVGFRVDPGGQIWVDPQRRHGFGLEKRERWVRKGR